MSEETIQGVRGERDKAYEERAKLVAFLAAVYPAELAEAESDSGAWWLVFVSTPAGQMSWHIHEDDLDLFEHLHDKPQTSLSNWDGHTTEQKYERLADLTARWSGAGGIARLDTALKRLADEDTCVLGEGLGGGPQEELHVRANLARQALGMDVCGCTECQVSLGLEPDDEDDDPLPVSYYADARVQ